MNDSPAQPDGKLNWLLGATVVVAILVVISVSRSLLELVFSPPAEASVQLIEAKPAAPPRAVARHAVAKRAWQPQYAVPRMPPREKAGTNEPSKTFKVEPFPPSVAAELRKRQMAYLRADLVENANDNPEDLPTLEDIATMEKNGVMVW